MTTGTVERKNTKNAQSSLVNDVLAQSEALANHDDEVSPEQLEKRSEIIRAAYETVKADYKLKNKVYVYYMVEIKKAARNLDSVLAHFKREIETMFEDGQLRKTQKDSHDDVIDSKAVFANVKRWFAQAVARSDKNSGRNEKGPDQDKTDPLASIKEIFKTKSLDSISSAFAQLRDYKRQSGIILSMFEMMTVEERAALYLDLEETHEKLNKEGL